MSELKPCPFCGGEARVLGHYPDSVRVECESCYAEVSSVDGESEVIAKWNRRTTAAEAATAAPTLTMSDLTIVRKALQRYRAQWAPGIEEVGAMGWHDNPEVTRQEVARVDAILAQLEELPQ